MFLVFQSILLAIPDQLMGGHINVLLVGLDKAGRIKLMHCFSLHVPTPDQQPMDGHICIHLVGLDEAGRRIRLGKNKVQPGYQAFSHG